MIKSPGLEKIIKQSSQKSQTGANCGSPRCVAAGKRVVQSMPSVIDAIKKERLS